MAVGQDVPRVPPFVVGGVEDVEDVPEAEGQRLAQKAAVLRLLRVEQRPAGHRTPLTPHGILWDPNTILWDPTATPWHLMGPH